MRVLSLFDGISCGQVALQRADIEVEEYLASEINLDSIKVTMHNFPKTKQLGNVINLKVEQIGEIDLLIGGSPCQDLSGAKPSGEGLNGQAPRERLRSHRPQACVPSR
jgi:DNA (cytosine-5)-methyltransferase 3A